jgi:hypothetical protein
MDLMCGSCCLEIVSGVGGSDILLPLCIDGDGCPTWYLLTATWGTSSLRLGKGEDYV